MCMCLESRVLLGNGGGEGQNEERKTTTKTKTTRGQQLSLTEILAR